MEEQRISKMYVNLLTGWLRRTWENTFPRGVLRSPVFFLLGIAALVLIPSAAWYLHVHAKFHAAKTDLGVNPVQTGPPVPRPGGAEAIQLQRAQTLGSTMPELLSATLLPGLGMDVLQITASLPGRGEVPLLMAPSVQALADNPAGPRNGILDDHGSLELPWAGTISGIISPLGSSLTTPWKGKTISVSRDPQERTGLAEGGMLATLPADAVELSPAANGAVATGSFHQTDFAGHWPSKTDVSVRAELTARNLDLTITAKNVGEEAEPMGIGWQPRFAIVGGNRSGIEMRLPGGQQMEIGDRSRYLPSGKLVAPAEAISRYQGHGGALGPTGLDEALVHLTGVSSDAGPSVELRNPGAGYGLRMVALSPAIQAVHVVAPSAGGYVSVGMQTNYDDALGREWNGDGIVTLAPGEQMQWKVRLEIFPVARK